MFYTSSMFAYLNIIFPWYYEHNEGCHPKNEDHWAPLPGFLRWEHDGRLYLVTPKRNRFQNKQRKQQEPQVFVIIPYYIKPICIRKIKDFIKLHDRLTIKKKYKNKENVDIWNYHI